MTTEDPWGQFAAALQREVAQLPDDSFLLLREPGTDQHFAQFWQSPTSLRAEVAGDELVGGPSGLLSEQGREVLAGVGFAAPVSLDDAGNWWREIAWPATGPQYQELVNAVVTALREVQGMTDPGVLIYHAWGYHTGPRRVDLPGVAPDPAKY